MAKNTEKNAKDYNKAARDKYNKKNYKIIAAQFKLDEVEKIDKYCEDNDITKNKLVHDSVMNVVNN